MVLSLVVDISITSVYAIKEQREVFCNAQWFLCQILYLRHNTLAGQVASSTVESTNVKIAIPAAKHQVVEPKRS